MAHEKRHPAERDLLIKLGKFSKNIAQNHHLENLSEFVVHELCAQDLFALPKAAYLVNNPDFACLKGLVGYHHPESFISDGSWKHQDDFAAHMKKASFNQKVRAIQDQSVNFDSDLHAATLRALADKLEIENPAFHTWPLKHANQGLLIYQKPYELDVTHDYLEHFISMLAFCPIF